MNKFSGVSAGMGLADLQAVCMCASTAAGNLLFYTLCLMAWIEGTKLYHRLF